MKQIKIPKRSYAFVDGSFNPTTQVYGCGGFLIDQFGKKHIIQGMGKNPEWAKMRNVAGEILGAKKAMQLAKKLQMKQLTIFHDYEGIANWPMGTWRAKKSITKDYVSFVWCIAATGISLYFVHVKGHSGIAGNVEADKLAREAVGLAAKSFREMAA